MTEEPINRPTGFLADAAATPITIPNTASRGTSVVFWLIAAAGLYSVSGRWPPHDFETWWVCFSVILFLAVAVRYTRGRVVLSSHGVVSHDIINRRFSWAQVSGFSVRGVMENKLGVELTDGRFVLLQYHHNAVELKRKLEAAREKVRPAGHSDA